MIVGRFLAHTGGTLDKLESIEGYNGLLPSHQFINIVKKVGISIIGQTDDICPADRKIYSLRGRTNTVASFPLICGSIMSKKIAEGIQGLVLDIKRGNGAFIKNSNDANKLGKLLALVGSKFGVKVQYINSDMSQPLGYSAGLLCEVEESVKALSGGGMNDLMDVVFNLGEIALNMAGQNNPKDRMLKVIMDGSARDIFFKMVYEHGGDLNKIYPNPKNNFDIISKKDGYLKYIDTKSIGNAVNYLTLLNGNIDRNAGIKFLKKNGDFVNKGDIIFQIFSDYSKNIHISEKMIKESYIMTENY
jgi:pyrimidine-nucleoside phosphorylase